MKFVDYPLRKLLDDGVSLEVIQNAFDEFQCSRNEDVEFFLREYAIENERIGASRSYLYMDSHALDQGRIKLIAFFTIAITDTDYSGVSNRRKRAIMGDYPRLSKEDHFPGYLLAQLARDDRFKKEDFDCSNLLGVAEGMIREAANSVGGNIIYLDCKERLIGYYEGFGYTLLPISEDCGFYKMFKGLPSISIGVQLERPLSRTPLHR